MWKYTIFLILWANVALSAIIKASQCGYQSCHPVKEDFINVHLVPHTHDDVGWLKTVDQYFYGANNTIQNAGVQYILDSVMDELKKDPNRRFIYVETAYFWKWWIHQHDIVKSQVRKYVNNGQLEFIGGAWSMNDEATTHYHSIIDQFTWGLRKLNDSFGECARPKIGWQIDPFGHSREMASIFAQLGFDALLLGRIDFQDKRQRFESKSAEMIWQGSDNLGESSKIFTGVMYNTYAPPPGFCFDILCEDEPLVDDKKSPLYNIDRKIDAFFDYLEKMTKVYTTNNLILTMGEDFNYQNAHTWFKNMDKLIYYANLRQQNGSKYNLIYSTPSCYIKAVNDANQRFPLKSDDFFPYASDGNSFWTGYFTSRPTLKRFERESNNFLQICKQLYSLTDLGPEDMIDLNTLREAMGIMQHHDAITGTEKQHVADDYARILEHGLEECQIIVNTALSKIITGEKGTVPDPKPKIPIYTCFLTNISSCIYTETQDKFIVTIYNPLSRPVSKYVQIPVGGKAYDVKDSDGISLPIQLLPIPESVLNIPGRKSEAKVELIFLASALPPLGFKSYTVTKKSGDDVCKEEQVTEIGNQELMVLVDPNTGFIVEVIMNGKTVKVNQEFFYYEGYVGNNEVAKNRSSGAYIFRPNSKEAIEVTSKAKYRIFKGDLVAEIQQIFNEWISQSIRLYKEENFIEFNWVVGPIPNNGTSGKEVITRFTTPLQTEGIFYTDSNGREILKRVRNARPTWNLSLEEPVAGNYYPITSKIVLIDDANDVELAILTDRAQGGSSLQDGQLEIMLHRNCLHDDAFGVGEALNETAFGKGLVARGVHHLILGPAKKTNGQISTAAQERDVSQRHILNAWTFVSPAYNASDNYTMKYSGLQQALPQNVQILTLEPWKGTSLLLRLEHVLEKSEDFVLSQPVVVDLKNLFTPFAISMISETTLGANQLLKDNDRLQFSSLGDHKNHKRATIIEAIDDYKIMLTPMQIRTFIIEIQKN